MPYMDCFAMADRILDLRVVRGLLIASISMGLAAELLDRYRRHLLKKHFPIPYDSTLPGCDRHLEIPVNCIGSVIGRKGRTLRKVEAETGAILNVRCYGNRGRGQETLVGDDEYVDEDDDDSQWFSSLKKEADKDGCDRPNGSSNAILHIHGDCQERVEKAIAMVIALMQASHQPPVVDYFNVPIAAVAFVLGRDGHSLRQLEEASKTEITISRSKNFATFERASIRGDRKSVDKAKNMLKARIEAYKNRRSYAWLPVLKNDDDHEVLEAADEKITDCKDEGNGMVIAEDDQSVDQPMA